MLRLCVVSEESFLADFIKGNASASELTVENVHTSDPESVSRLLPDFDYVLMNHRTSLNRRIIEKLEDRTKIIDLSVAKTPMSRYKGQLISLALINKVGEESGKPEYELAVIRDISTENAVAIASQIFPGVQIVEKTSDEHDKLMSEILVKPYIFSLLSRKVTNLDQVPKTGEYEMALELSRYVNNYNIDHIRDLLRNNPYTPEVFSKMEDNLKRVWNELSFF